MLEDIGAINRFETDLGRYVTFFVIPMKMGHLDSSLTSES